MCRYRKHRQWQGKAASNSHHRANRGKIPSSNSFRITSRYLAGGTELAPNLITDEALNQKLQDYKCFTIDRNPKAEGFAALLSSSTVKTIT